MALWGVGEGGREWAALSVLLLSLACAFACEEGIRWRGRGRLGVVELGEAVLEVGNLLHQFGALRVVWLGHGGGDTGGEEEPGEPPAEHARPL